MRTKSFFDLTHAQNYLNGCVIRLKEEPIYIRETLRTEKSGIYQLRYRHLGQFTDHYTTTDSKNINMVPVPLGMLSVDLKSLQMGYQTCMVYRSPVRRWKVGLCNENAVLLPVDKVKLDIGVSSVLTAEELRRTILDIYPPLKAAIKLTDDTGKTVAISRKFAIRGRNLYYKEVGLPIGYVEKGETVLAPNFSYLKQELEQDGLL